MFYSCCIPQCRSSRKNSKLHKFPSSKRRQIQWLDAIKCDKLYASSNLEKLHICSKHFEKRFVSKKGGLIMRAYPSLITPDDITSNLPSVHFNEDKENPDHDYSRKMHSDHNYTKDPPPLKDSKLDNKGDITDSVPLTSTMEVDDNSDNYQEVNWDITDSVPPTSTVEVDNRSSKLQEANWDITDSVPPTSTVEVDDNSSKLQEANCLPKVVSKKKFKRNFKCPNPKCQTLYHEYRKSQRQLVYAKRSKNALSFKKQFDAKTAEMNEIAKCFLWMQFNLCRKKGKARRFSMDEKLIALTIRKQSFECYKFLRKIFILPSKVTLNRMEEEIKLLDSMDTQVLDGTNNDVSDSEENNESSTTMFDETATEPAVVTYINNFVVEDGLSSDILHIG